MAGTKILSPRKMEKVAETEKSSQPPSTSRIANWVGVTGQICGEYFGGVPEEGRRFTTETQRHREIELVEVKITSPRIHTDEHGCEKQNLNAETRGTEESPKWELG
jgi:hypothetical protein